MVSADLADTALGISELFSPGRDCRVGKGVSIHQRGMVKVPGKSPEGDTNI